jgi:dTDP-4-amino-4,6-dideoxygalactose transaminase
MIRLVPPAGTKLNHRQVLRAATELVLARGTPGLTPSLPAEYGHVLGTGSGRSALLAILSALHRLCPERTTVIIPGYTCFSVAAAVAQAQLRIRLVDVNPRTLEMDAEQLAKYCDGQALAIVHTELFGFIGNTDRLRAMAHQCGANFVEDAAQAFGSTQNGKHAGTLGDVGFFSIGRGKPLYGISGGLIVTQSDEIRDAIHCVTRKFAAASAGRDASELLKLVAYYLFFHPSRYRAVESLPFLKIGATEFDPSFENRQLSRLAQVILEESICIATDGVAQRNETVAKIRAAVAAGGDFSFPSPDADEQPCYPRLPVIAASPWQRTRTISALRRVGIGASIFYPTAISEIPGINRYLALPASCCPNAEWLAARLFTLPTHSLVTERDVANIGLVLNREVGGTRPANSTNRIDSQTPTNAKVAMERKLL